MILSCNQLEKAFGEQMIVTKGAFHIEDTEKVALVGANGAGKSTILKMIMNEEPLDDGTIIVSKDKTIGYLSQHQVMTSHHTIFEEISTALADIILLEKRIRELEQTMNQVTGEELEQQLSEYHRSTTLFEQKNGYAYHSELTGILKGLGFTENEFSQQVNSLSGGQKTRVSLGKLLLKKPDILLLDEPTNHLDMNSISWLETYLLNYKGAVLIVSHDRYFINRVVTKVVEIERGSLTMFSGNYSDYATKKALIREIKVKEYFKQQQEIKHQEAVIDKLKSFNREKSIKRAESREKALAKIDRIDKPIVDDSSMHFHLEPCILSGNDVLSVHDCSKAFDNKILFQNIDFDIKRGEHVAIIGDNGTGKTTMLKIINDIIPSDSGEFILGSNVEIGYYDQEHHVLNMNKTMFDEISDDYPHLTNTQIRNTLAAFLFTGDDVYKRIGDLSGGERGRVSLAKLMLSEANFLILDEPTNHLDIQSKEILEKAISGYTGTVLYVSHDRYFINQTATRILDLKSHTFTNYIGNYDYYIEKKDILAPQNALLSSDISSETVTDVKIDWKAQKEQQAAQRKRENDLKKTEDEIHLLETRDSEIDHLLQQTEIFTDVEKCMQLTNEKNDILEKLEILYEQWEILQE
ncbi:MAG: ABC-F family ATP-binding cassette domain-containing protein [Eubacteriales bacterium]